MKAKRNKATMSLSTKVGVKLGAIYIVTGTLLESQAGCLVGM